jgi:hypothetical protein
LPALIVGDHVIDELGDPGFARAGVSSLGIMRSVSRSTRAYSSGEKKLERVGGRLDLQRAGGKV